MDVRGLSNELAVDLVTKLDRPGRKEDPSDGAMVGTIQPHPLPFIREHTTTADLRECGSTGAHTHAGLRIDPGSDRSHFGTKPPGRWASAYRRPQIATGLLWEPLGGNRSSSRA